MLRSSETPGFRYAVAQAAMEAAKKAGWAIGTTPPPKSYDPVIMYPWGPRDPSAPGFRRPNAPLPSFGYQRMPA